MIVSVGGMQVLKTENTRYQTEMANKTAQNLRLQFLRKRRKETRFRQQDMRILKKMLPMEESRYGKVQ